MPIAIFWPPPKILHIANDYLWTQASILQSQEVLQRSSVFIFKKKNQKNSPSSLFSITYPADPYKPHTPEMYMVRFWQIIQLRSRVYFIQDIVSTFKSVQDFPAFIYTSIIFAASK